MPSFSALQRPSLDDVESRLIWIFGSPRSRLFDDLGPKLAELGYA
jgi:hypothetical protein